MHTDRGCSGRRAMPRAAVLLLLGLALLSAPGACTQPPSGQPVEPDAPASAPENSLGAAVGSFLEGRKLGQAQPGAALAAYERAVTLQPEVAVFQLWRDEVGEVVRSWEKELASLDRAIVESPGDARRLCSRGNALLLLGRIDEGVESYGRCWDSGARVSEWLGWASWLMRLGRHAEAVRAYDQILAVVPDQFEARHGRGVALVHLGRLEEALPLFEASKHAEGPVYRALTLKRLGRNADALKAYNQSYIAQVLQREGFPEGALEVLDYAAARTGNSFYEDLYIRLYRGDAFLSLGRYEEALAIFDEALPAFDEAPESPKLRKGERDWGGTARAHGGRADALAHLQRYGEAVAAYELEWPALAESGKVGPNKHN